MHSTRSATCMFFRLYVTQKREDDVADVLRPDLVVRLEGVEHVNGGILPVFEIVEQLVLRCIRWEPTTCTSSPMGCPLS